MADEWFDGNDMSAGERFAAKDALMALVTDLATIAREAEAMVAGHKERITHEVERYRRVKAEADKWRKVAEWLAMDGGLWSPAGAAKRIAHALAAVEQEKTK